ncbi:MAG: S-layer homology domain-containing protein, partial [Candidatus Riflebacteria bacterium]
MLKRSFLVCLLMLVITTSLSAAAFSRMPENHWAWESVQKLMDRGIFDQNNFKDFAGDRNMTRYEFAITYSRFLAHVAEKMGDGSLLATKDDLAALDQLNQEFASELALLGIRNEGLENDMAVVKEDVSTLKSEMVDINKAMVKQIEKVKLTGNWLTKATWKT